jgi:murein DD-endopeptidase MepM/ murein hydrolase activator NlpD
MKIRTSLPGLPSQLFLFFFLTVLLSLSGLPAPLHAQDDPSSEWHLLYVRIRDGLISKEEARTKLKAIEERIRNNYPDHSNHQKDVSLIFPLEGYSLNAIGGHRGNGYQIKNYDFFDGNRHQGHPGHDLFIRDVNQDGLDDKTGRPVNIIAVSSGKVVSINLNWEPSSQIRGGNYIWIYEPLQGRYYYYAHLQDIFVTVGQTVLQGDRLGTVGRTGKNAFPKRSPTHLHFTVHASKDGHLTPVNPYMDWIKAYQK